MIGSDEENVAVLLSSLENGTDGSISGLNTLDSGLIDTSVANHIGGSEVVHDKIELLLSDALSHLLTDSGSRHLRLEIVGSNTGGGDKLALLAGELLLNTTVEEEGNVSVLLGLGNVALLELLLAKPLSKNVTHVLGRESNGEGIVGLVLSHGGEVSVLGVREVRDDRAVEVTQELSDLTNTVGTVVEEEEGIVILETTLIAVDNDGLQELVVLTSLVAGLDGSDGVGGSLTLTLDETVQGNGDTLPSLITVHSIVSADNGSDLTKTNRLGLVEKLLHVTSSRLGVGITAVTEEVDVDLRNAHLLSNIEKNEEVVHVSVDTTVGNETEKVESAVAINSALEGLDDIGDIAHLALLDGLVNADNVLPHDTTGTDVQVTDLRVTHEALGKTDGEGRGIDLSVARGLGLESVHVRGVGSGDGITLGRGVGASDTPAINDNCIEAKNMSVYGDSV